ncbi:MAG: polysaccharide deacetylase family protein [Pseudomonadales bacterium]|nr:polysaccharide deacetylase family protein [Pseudomonadales bacterium]
MKTSVFLTVFSSVFLMASNAVAEQYPKPEQRMVPLALECRSPGVIALTFDDGPSANYPQIIDTFEYHNAKATFFMVGSKLEKQHHIDEAMLAVNAGHQIENHSWDHPDFTTISNAQITSQVDKTNEILWTTLGVVPRFVRPPYGRIDVPKAMPIWDMDYGIALWNIDSEDYRKTSLLWGPGKVLDKINGILNTSSPSEDSFIILLHDASDTSIEKLGDILTTIKEHGYSIVTLDECVDNKGL